ncbi:hypothetical protein Gogos_011175 [Gossypium gossypioides]|uniref:Uncharacterized protein n=1 Tax=Gossypium gossypioides TaxID=34282 RepID=A0A7J9BNG5_GOSGO|nr:hypothetical protein [Gossypium gossypioides]
MQQSWKLNIQARTQIFNFKLKATKILPTGEFHRFSLLLRLHKFILKLRLKSGPTVSISSQQKRSLKSRFLSFLEKIRLRRERKGITIQYPDVKSVLHRVKQFTDKAKIMFQNMLGIGFHGAMPMDVLFFGFGLQLVA